MTVKWTKTALINLGLIADYISRDNGTRAKTFVQEIYKKANVLTEFPTIGRPGRVIGTRELIVHKNYIIAYRVRGEDAEIIRVHHVAKQWPSTFD